MAFGRSLRVGELKSLLALSCASGEAIAEGCEWIRHFGQINAERGRVYNCIESPQKLGDAARCDSALLSLYGAETLRQADALLKGELRFFDQPSLGLDMANCAMHQRLLAGYGKLYKGAQSA